MPILSKDRVTAPPRMRTQALLHILPSGTIALASSLRRIRPIDMADVTLLPWRPPQRFRCHFIPECNSKPVAIKASIRWIASREEDAQRTAAGHLGQECATAASRARAQPGSTCL